jgi:aldehyde dehydrogenase (NAD+)
MDYETDLGPLVSGPQRQRVLGFIAAGKAEGAELLLGGGTPELPGWFVQPTIFGRVTNDMAVAREEVFGPVLCVIPYADLDEALRIANDTPYGLAAGVFGSDYVEAVDYAQRLRAGSVWINDYHQISPHMPFGGFKRSGIGREMGFEGIRAYTETQSFYVDLARKRDQKFYGLVCSAE